MTKLVFHQTQFQDISGQCQLNFYLKSLQLLCELVTFLDDFVKRLPMHLIISTVKIIVSVFYRTKNQVRRRIFGSKNHLKKT